MAPEIHRFGATTIAKAKTARVGKEVLEDRRLESDPIIVKPNWVTDEAGTFTMAETLRKLGTGSSEFSRGTRSSRCLTS